ncbi:DUF4340 domain-containing protein [Pontibacter sp. G13]|uniref:DUF4340 domain-containing protein n=1 Tax=Pontibacter sp. G13 TaxID=3074898 RepID=UPI00288901A1|nr:DUF4340 domain-containing protein [Pontibacter sp. G13]WNJ21229.1 hypothetical protein RJD25_12240 [Pontibacter sp. G13]
MRNIWILLLVLVVGLAAYFTFFHGQSGTSFSQAEVNFALEDTASVQEIILTSVENGTPEKRQKLTRIGADSWTLNDSMHAFAPKVRQMLKTLHLIHVTEHLNEAAQASAEELLLRYHIRIEVKSSDGSEKTYFMGPQAPQGNGTIMKLKGASKPYLVSIPGWVGYINPSFNMSETNLRENLLFRTPSQKLASIQWSYPKSGKESQTLIREGQSDTWMLNGTPVADTAALNAFLAKFDQPVFAESFADPQYPGKRAYLADREADYIFTVKTLEGDQREITLYERTDNPSNMFGWVNGKDELLTIQHFVFDPFLVEAAEFQN